jgi:hypothetical protein
VAGAQAAAVAGAQAVAAYPQPLVASPSSAAAPIASGSYAAGIPAPTIDAPAVTGGAVAAGGAAPAPTGGVATMGGAAPAQVGNAAPTYVPFVNPPYSSAGAASTTGAVDHIYSPPVAGKEPRSPRLMRLAGILAIVGSAWFLLVRLFMRFGVDAAIEALGIEAMNAVSLTALMLASLPLLAIGALLVADAAASRKTGNGDKVLFYIIAIFVSTALYVVMDLLAHRAFIGMSYDQKMLGVDSQAAKLPSEVLGFVQISLLFVCLLLFIASAIQSRGSQKQKGAYLPSIILLIIMILLWFFSNLLGVFLTNSIAHFYGAASVQAYSLTINLLNILLGTALYALQIPVLLKLAKAQKA